MADDVTITVHVRDLTGPGFNSVSRNLNQLQRQASSMGGSLRIVGGHLDDVASSAANAGSSLGGGAGLKGHAIGAAAALGTSLLPTVGALAPMLSGVAVVGGGAALAMDDLKKKAKELKPAFESWQKAAEKAVAPHTERAVKSLKSAMKDLEPSLVLGAETFGTITERASKFAASPAFQGAFQRNVQMGVVFVEQMAESVGHFTQALLDFGTKSQPALDAWQNLLGGFLDTGLPSMFRELEQGIGGSSQMLNGLASFLNEGLLPGLGKVAGSFMEAFGPLLGQMLVTAGELLDGFGTSFEGLMEGVEPVAKVFADAWRAVNEVFKIGSEVSASFAKNVGGPLLEGLLAVFGVDTSTLQGDFTALSDWVNQNQGAIRGAFFGVAKAITHMVATGVSTLPKLWGAFEFMSSMALTAVDVMISGLAKAFGDVPVIGDIFKDANTKFDEFATGARSSLDSVGGKIQTFVDNTLPGLNRAQFKFRIDEAQANLDHIKNQLEDPSLTAERRAKLTADKKAAEAALAQAKRELAEFDRRKASATIDANPNPFFSHLSRANQAKLNKKLALLGANPALFNAAVAAINGRTVGTAYINVQQRFVASGADNRSASRFRAMGGPVRGYASGGDVQAFPEGGYVQGPGSGTSDSILAFMGSGAAARVSNTEYVVRASSVQKYGLRFLDALNEGRLKIAGFARGGSVSKAEREARNSARGDLTISHFGRMAGHQRSEFGSALGRPDSARSLIDALNQWRTTILKATHGGTERSLLRALDSTGKKLLTYQKQLDKASSSLEKSKARLDELRQAASQLRESVMNGVLNSANITKGAQGDAPVTVRSIMGGLTASRDKATAFSKALTDLRKRGVSGALIQQIGEAGIDGGGLETASALLRASSSEIKSMNSLQSQITGAAATAGKTTADAVYANQIKGQERLVKAWDNTVKILGSKMDKLAAAMEKAIERGFGRRAAGGIIGAASGGARGSWTLVGEHEPELVRLPFGSRVYSGPDTRRMLQQPSWASMLNTPRSGGARYTPTPAPGPGGGGRVVYELVVNLDGRTVARQIFDPLRKETRVRGVALDGRS